MTQDQLKELETLNERWANECPTQRKMLDCALDIMDLLPDVIAHIGELTTERDAALKACAEMRDALSHLKAADMEWCDAMALADHALSTSCGKGYHADSEWDLVLMVLKDIATDDLDRVSGGVKQSAQQALAHAERITGGGK